MAVVAAGALALAGCTSETETPEEGTTAPEAGGDTESETGDAEDETATSGGEAGGEGSTGKADLGDVVTADDEISFSTGSEQYNAYNGDTSATNSTYNATVNNQLQSGFWYWGTDGAIYPNEWFGSYEVTSEDPLTVEYTISDEAVWSDGTPITANDYLLEWASSNPEALGGAEALGFDPVSDTFGKYVPEVPEAEVDGKTFTVVYPEPYPDWELVVSGVKPSHVVAEQSGLEPSELIQAIIDGDGETVAQASEFWNTGWVFNDYEISDESIVPSSGPYTLQGAVWEKDQSLGLVPNEEFWGTPPATANLVFKFAAPETHVQALQNGDINVIEPQATVDTVDQLKNMGDTVIGYSAPNQRRTDEVTTIKASCDEAGFNIVDAGDPTFFQQGGPLETGDWEVALFAWAGSGQIASGQPIYSTDGGQNYGGYSNETVDEAWETLATSNDPAVHMEQTKVIEKELWDTLYGIPVFAHPGVVGYDSTIENVRHTSVQTGVSWNAEQWVRAN